LNSPTSSLKSTMDLLVQTDGEIARVRGPNPEWLFVIVRGARAQGAVNRAIDAYEGLPRHG
jgi:hypothetical protein